MDTRLRSSLSLSLRGYTTCPAPVCSSLPMPTTHDAVDKGPRLRLPAALLLWLLPLRRRRRRR